MSFSTPELEARMQKAIAALHDAADLDACLDAMDAALLGLPSTEGFMIPLYLPEEKMLANVRLRLAPQHAAVEKSFLGFRFPMAEGDTHFQAFKTRAPVRVTAETVGDLSPQTRERFQQWGYHHLEVIPIWHPLSALPPVGNIALFSHTGLVSSEAIEFARQLGQEAASLIRLHQRSAQWEQRAFMIEDTEAALENLLQFISEVSNLSTDREIYPRIQREFLERYSHDFAAIYLADSGILHHADMLTNEDIPWRDEWQSYCREITFELDTKSATGSAFLNNRLLHFGDVPGILHMPMADRDRKALDIARGLLSLTFVPIRKEHRAIGVLWLGSLRSKNALSAAQQSQIQLLCDFLGFAIENARTYTLVETQRREIEDLVSALQHRVEALDHLANRDRLTGLFNFGSFEVEANKKINGYMHQRHPLPLSLIMCDVDHFKRFNDTYGHVAGNVILQEVADRISRTVRDSDYVARYGGEEFAILLPRCDLEAAFRLAERIRANIANRPFIVDGIEHQITLSLGCTQYSRAFAKLADFTAHADTALYAAKHGGRNRVEKAPLLGDPASAPDA
ncbi:MAG TPA: sensor domain-containing diguanylate cyclase [Rhodocyclaceae bacterium]|nr:sensor domain-containing diguanylate cyclase [Rhodocyclaceae bacterium]